MLGGISGRKFQRSNLFTIHEVDFSRSYREHLKLKLSSVVEYTVVSKLGGFCLIGNQLGDEVVLYPVVGETRVFCQ